MASESDESSIVSNAIDTPGDDKGNGQLKKGPWSPGEDAILTEYVTKNGEGNWFAVPKQTGLAREGKSCRLRWVNQLKPGLKKCALSPEEEQLVIELHAKMGNKWAQIATKLPGRTDNEIKNFWNTRIKRVERAGLPIYPPGIERQSSNEENKQSGNTMTTFPHLRPDSIPFTNVEFPTIEFKSLNLSHDLYRDLYPGLGLVDIPSSTSLLPQGLHSMQRFQGSENIFPSIVNAGNDGSIQMRRSFEYPYDHSMQRFQGSENMAPSFGNAGNDGSIQMGRSFEYPYDHSMQRLQGSENMVPSFGNDGSIQRGRSFEYPYDHSVQRFQGSENMSPSIVNAGNDGSTQMGRSFEYPYDHNLTNHDHASSVVDGSHAGLYGNPSSLEPDWAMETGLPSLQTQTGSSWVPPVSPLQPVGSFDTLIQNPLTVNSLLDNSNNTGLLDAIVSESQTVDRSVSHAFDEMEWDAYGEHLPPCYSSFFSDDNPFNISFLFDEPESLERGSKVNEDETIFDPNQYGDKGGEPTR